MMRSFPTGLNQVIREMGLEPQTVLYAFQSLARFDGQAGEAWFIVGRSGKHVKAVLINGTPLQDFTPDQSTNLEEVTEIRLFETFLGDLTIEFTGKGKKVLLGMIVPGLQRRQWQEFFNDLSSVYGGKISWQEAEHGVLVDPLKFVDNKVGAIYDETNGPFEKLKKTNLTKVASDLDKTMARLKTFDMEVIQSDFGIDTSEDINIRIDEVEECPDKPEATRRSKHRRPHRERREAAPHAPPPQTSEDTPKPVASQVRCFKCGRMNAPNYVYCMACGKPLDPGASGPAQPPDRKIRAGIRTGKSPAEMEAASSGCCLSGCLTQLMYLIILAFALMIIVFLTD
jgi:hypothetical protein